MCCKRKQICIFSIILFSLCLSWYLYQTPFGIVCQFSFVVYILHCYCFFLLLFFLVTIFPSILCVSLQTNSFKHVPFRFIFQLVRLIRETRHTTAGTQYIYCQRRRIGTPPKMQTIATQWQWGIALNRHLTPNSTSIEWCGINSILAKTLCSRHTIFFWCVRDERKKQ